MLALVLILFVHLDALTAAVSFRAYATAAMGVAFFASTATICVTSPPAQSPLLASCACRICPE